MIGVFGILSVLYLYLIVKGNVIMPVYIGFGAAIVLTALSSLMMRVWRIEFDERDDQFLYRSSFAVTHKISYGEILSYNEDMNAITLKTAKKTFVMEPLSVNIELFLKELRKHHVPKAKRNMTIQMKTSHKVIYLIIGIGWTGMAVFLCTLAKKEDWWLAVVFIVCTVMVIYSVIRAFRWKITIHSGLSYFEYRGAFSKVRNVNYKNCTAKEWLHEYIVIKEGKKHIIANSNAENIDLLKKEMKANGKHIY